MNKRSEEIACTVVPAAFSMVHM